MATYIYEHARLLERRGHKVVVLYPHHFSNFLGISRGISEKQPKQFDDNGITTIYSFTQSFIPRLKRPPALGYTIIYNKALKLIRTYIKENGVPNIIHAHSTDLGGMVASFISKRIKVPFVLTKHYSGWISDSERYKDKAYRRNIVDTISESNETMVVSPYYRDQLVNRYPLNRDKITCLPNMVNSIFFDYFEPIKIENEVILSIVGYLKENKNHEIFLQGVKILLDQGYKLKVKVIGSGEKKAELVALVKKLAISKAVFFLGMLQRKQVAQELANSHILVSASKVETFGINIAEALAVGRPVVVLDSGGPRSIVKPNNGLLFSENTSIGFSDAIKTVVDSFESFNQKRISKECKAQFGEDFIYEELLTRYKKYAN